MFDRLNDIWQKWGFEIILGVCLAFILIYSLIRSGKKGSWSNTYKYLPQERNGGRRGPPKESKGEIECRRVLEKLLNKPFPKIRPDFLRNPIGTEQNFELDCYCSTLNLAVEYNGVQHYKYVPYFHKNKDMFQNQKYRDEIKRRMCKDYGINLIEVPYTVKVEEIEDYLIKNLKSLGYLS